MASSNMHLIETPFIIFLNEGSDLKTTKLDRNKNKMNNFFFLLKEMKQLNATRNKTISFYGFYGFMKRETR